MNQEVNRVFRSQEEAESFLVAEQFLAKIIGERFYPEVYMNPEIVGEHWQDDPITLWWFGKADGNE